MNQFRIYLNSIDKNSKNYRINFWYKKIKIMKKKIFQKVLMYNNHFQNKYQENINKKLYILENKHLP